MPNYKRWDRIEPPKKEGRPRHVPTPEMRQQVSTFMGLGIEPRKIASYVKLDFRTLEKYYKYELETGATRANIEVSGALFRSAVEEGSVPAQIWWTKARMGWRDRSAPAADATEPGALHLLAAQIISDKLAEARRDGRLIEAPTIDADPAEAADWRDEPKPSE